MSNIAKKHEDRLQCLKDNVEKSHAYFKDNYDRYDDFAKFVFKSSLSEQDVVTLQNLGKPTLEFNILESYVSRLRGEFAKQQPSLQVRAEDGIPINQLTPDFLRTIEIIEQHLRAMFFDATNDMLEYKIYSDLLVGGFSVVEVYTDYINEMSFEQSIYVDRVFEPTLCGFDPLARKSHKGDGNYCFQLYPRTRKEFEEEFGKAAAEKMKYAKGINGFGWSYRDEKEEIVLLCDYFEKKKKRVKILKLSNGQALEEKEYQRLLKQWEEQGLLEQPPIIINERFTERTTIVRYRFCENQVLDYKETDFRHLPLVFIDGNSVMLKNGTSQYQMTRPYVYHAEGLQKLKNFAGQSLANELENLVQHKFVVAEESIPEVYTEAYNNIQKAQTLIYKHFLDEQAPEVILPPPREIQRTPIPPEITNTFRMSDEMTQVILGAYDSALGVNKQEISGAAIALGAMQSNNASVPYIVGYIAGLNRVGEIVLDLIPKYYRTPRSLPVLKSDGKRSFEIINKAGSVYMNYDPHSLQVKVETGVNFAMQKEIALKTLISLMQASPTFAEFMNTSGLSILLDNIEIRGIDGLKKKAEQFQQQAEQNQQQQMQAQQQSAQVQQQMEQMQLQMQQLLIHAEAQRTQAEGAKAAKEAQAPTRTEIDAMKMQQDAQFKEVEAQQKQQKIDMDFTEMMAKIQSMDTEQMMKAAELDAENARTAVESLHTLMQVGQKMEPTEPTDIEAK